MSDAERKTTWNSGDSDVRKKLLVVIMYELLEKHQNTLSEESKNNMKEFEEMLMEMDYDTLSIILKVIEGVATGEDPELTEDEQLKVAGLMGRIMGQALKSGMLTGASGNGRTGGGSSSTVMRGSQTVTSGNGGEITSQTSGSLSIDGNDPMQFDVTKTGEGGVFSDTTMMYGGDGGFAFGDISFGTLNVT